MNEQELRQALETQVNRAGWEFLTFDELLENGVILRADGTRYQPAESSLPLNAIIKEEEDSEENRARKRVAKIVKSPAWNSVMAAVANDMMGGQPVFIYKAGEDMPCEMRITEDQTRVETENKPVEKPEEVPEPGAFLLFFDSIAQFFHSRVAACKKYEDYLVKRLSYNAFEAEKEERAGIEAKLKEMQQLAREKRAKAREEEAKARAEGSVFEKAVTGAAERIRDVFHLRLDQITEKYDIHELDEFYARKEAGKELTVEEERAVLIHEAALSGANNPIFMIRALVNEDPTVRQNAVVAAAFIKDNPQFDSKPFSDYLNGSLSPDSLDVTLLGGRSIGSEISDLQGISSVVACGGVARPEQFEQFATSLANVQEHLNPETRLRDVNYLRDLYMKNVGNMNDQFRAASLSDFSAPQATPDVLSAACMLGTKLYHTAQTLQKMGEMLFLECGIRTPEMAACLTRVQGIGSLCEALLPVADSDTGAHLSELPALSGFMKKAEKESLQFIREITNGLSPLQRTEAARKAEALSVDSAVDPIMAREMLGLSSRTLTPEEARNLAAREMLDHLTVQSSEQRQEMANYLAKDHRFMEVVGDDPERIAKALEGGVLQEKVQKIAEDAVRLAEEQESTVLDSEIEKGSAVEKAADEARLSEESSLKANLEKGMSQDAQRTVQEHAARQRPPTA